MLAIVDDGASVAAAAIERTTASLEDIRHRLDEIMASDGYQPHTSATGLRPPAGGEEQPSTGDADPSLHVPAPGPADARTTSSSSAVRPSFPSAVAATARPGSASVGGSPPVFDVGSRRSQIRPARRRDRGEEARRIGAVETHVGEPWPPEVAATMQRATELQRRRKAELPVALPLSGVLARNEDMVVALMGARAYSDGIELAVTIRSRQPHRALAAGVSGRGPLPEQAGTDRLLLRSGGIAAGDLSGPRRSHPGWNDHHTSARRGPLHVIRMGSAVPAFVDELACSLRRVARGVCVRPLSVSVASYGEEGQRWGAWARRLVLGFRASCVHCSQVAKAAERGASGQLEIMSLDSPSMRSWLQDAPTEVAAGGRPILVVVSGTEARVYVGRVAMPLALARYLGVRRSLRVLRALRRDVARPRAASVPAADDRSAAVPRRTLLGGAAAAVGLGTAVIASSNSTAAAAAPTERIRPEELKQLQRSAVAAVAGNTFGTPDWDSAQKTWASNENRWLYLVPFDRANAGASHLLTSGPVPDDRALAIRLLPTPDGGGAAGELHAYSVEGSPLGGLSLDRGGVAALEPPDMFSGSEVGGIGLKASSTALPTQLPPGFRTCFQAA